MFISLLNTDYEVSNKCEGTASTELTSYLKLQQVERGHTQHLLHFADYKRKSCQTDHECCVTLFTVDYGTPIKTNPATAQQYQYDIRWSLLNRFRTDQGCLLYTSDAADE